MGTMSLEYTKVTEDEGEVGKILMRDFMPPNRKGYLRVGPDKVFLPETFLDVAKKVRDLEVREDDVWVVTHPKTGTTWTQEMVWCIKNDLDFEGAKQFLADRFPFLECTILVDPTPYPRELPLFLKDSVQVVVDRKSPRFIKTHLPWSLLPQQIQDGTKQPKMVYVCRNPKDTCVSYFHHCLGCEGYSGNFDDFCTLFLGGSLLFAPFWSHVLGFWERRDHPNILFLKYEDMKKDLPSVVRKTADFLEKSLTDEQVATLAKHLTFETMKKNVAVNYDDEEDERGTEGDNRMCFMRGGRVGDGEKDMKRETIEKFDAMTEKHLQGTGLVL